MSIYTGPEISSDNLMFHYDMNNTQKSFKGAPTTNLHTQPTNFANGNWSVQVNSTSTAVPSVVDALGGSLAYQYTLVNTVTSNQLFLRNVTPTANTTYTYSCYFKYVSGSPKINFAAYMYGSPAGWNGVTINVAGPESITLTSFGTITNPGYQYVGNGWFRVWFSWSQTSVTGAVEFNINYEIAGGITSYAISSWYVCYAQFEAQTFATPFVAGTRSTSQALTDLTGKNTITATSLTYNSNGTFSFDGTNSITVPFNASNFDFNSEQTIIVWMKATDTTVRRNPYNQAYGGGGTITHETNSAFRYFYGTTGIDGGTSGVTYTAHWSTATVVAGETAMIALTRNPSVTTWYKNGVFDNALTNPYGSSVVTGTNPILIGTGYTTGFAGSIYNVQVYNRALSAAEIKQNFTALRGRYGI